MNKQTQVTLKAPYLLLIGAINDAIHAKTALGIIQWCPDLVAGQLRFEGNTLDLGVPDMSIQQAVEEGVKSLVIGVAPVGGELDNDWLIVLKEAAEAGLDIVNGLHTRLETLPGIEEVASRSGVGLINVRTPPPNLPIGTGIKRSGKRVLTVGSDCSAGKKYTALALTASLTKNFVSATFRATGQTGIMIAGCGMPLDSVVADFVAGAAEALSPDNEPDHWDVIEGQGSLFNPSYAGISIALLHGSQADAIVMCHDAKQTVIGSCPHLSVPSIEECIELNLQCGRLTNPDIACVGISVNTSGFESDERHDYLQALEEKTGLPCVDSMIDGCEAIARKLMELG